MMMMMMATGHDRERILPGPYRPIHRDILPCDYRYEMNFVVRELHEQNWARRPSHGKEDVVTLVTNSMVRHHLATTRWTERHLTTLPRSILASILQGYTMEREQVCKTHRVVVRDERGTRLQDAW